MERSVSIFPYIPSISPPNPPSGASAGAIGTRYTYTTGGAVSSTGDTPQYLFNWGDGTNSGWLAPGTLSASHSWTSAGTYQVTAQAEDVPYGLTSTSGSTAMTILPPAPTLTSVSPSGVLQGTAVSMTLTGTNFVVGATTVSTNNSGVAVSAVRVANSTSLTATFTVGSGATTGATNVTVTTSGGTSGAKSFTIYAPVVTSIATFPVGLTVSVDGVSTPCNPYCNYTWVPGSSHTLAASTQAGGTGTQWVWSTWSDGGGASHGITASASGANYTANYGPQYYFTSAISPANAGTLSQGSGWFNAGAAFWVSAAANQGYEFSSLSPGGSFNDYETVMNGPVTVTANFVAFSGQTVTSLPAGALLTVDGTACVTPCSFNWTLGTQHTVGTASTQTSSAGTQYVFTTWSDGSAGLSDTIVAAAGKSYTANYTTQFWLATAANPSSGGTVSPPSGWYNGGQVVQVSATAVQTAFAGFSGDLSGTANPQSVTMNGPKSVTANFSGVVVTTRVLPVGVAGFGYSTALAATGGSGGYSWTVAQGALPPGLGLSGTGTISGTPSAAGTSSLTLRATDTSGNPATAVLSLAINNAGLSITGSLSNAVVGVGYSAQMTALGGSPSYSWTWSPLAGGTLPPGLTLANGVVSGTATVAGTYQVAVKVTDGNSATVTRNYSVAVVKPRQLTAHSVVGLPGDCNDSYSVPNDGSMTTLSYCVGSFDGSNFSCTSGVDNTFPTGIQITNLMFSDPNIRTGAITAPSRCIGVDAPFVTFDVEVSAAGAMPGPYGLSLNYQDMADSGATALTLSDAVQVTDASPAIYGVSPNTTYAGQQTPVTLNGNNFGSSGAVEVCTNATGSCVPPADGTSATVSSWSANVIGVQLNVDPSAAVGTQYYFQVGVSNDMFGEGFLNSDPSAAESSTSGEAVTVEAAQVGLRIVSHDLDNETSTDVTGSTQTVTVGQWVDLSLEITNPVSQAYTYQWSYPPGYAVTGWQATTPTSAPTQLTEGDLQDGEIGFAWADPGMARQIQVKATPTAGGTPMTATVTYDVVLPEITILPTEQAPVLTANPPCPGGYAGMCLFNPTSGADGFVINPDGVQAQNGIQWLQVLNSVTLTSKNSSGAACTISLTGLDGTLSQPSGNQNYSMADSPGVSIPQHPADQEQTYVMDASTFLMFKPDEFSDYDVWVPIGKVDWSWSGDAAWLQGTTWQLKPGFTPPESGLLVPSQTSIYPSWAVVARASPPCTEH